MEAYRDKDVWQCTICLSFNHKSKQLCKKCNDEKNTSVKVTKDSDDVNDGKIKEYVLICKDKSEDLNKEVNRYLQNGYELYFGPLVNLGPGYLQRYTQAMIKR